MGRHALLEPQEYASAQSETTCTGKTEGPEEEGYDQKP